MNEGCGLCGGMAGSRKMGPDGKWYCKPMISLNGGKNCYNEKYEDIDKCPTTIKTLLVCPFCKHEHNPNDNDGWNLPKKCKCGARILGPGYDRNYSFVRQRVQQ